MNPCLSSRPETEFRHLRNQPIPSGSRPHLLHPLIPRRPHPIPNLIHRYRLPQLLPFCLPHHQIPHLNPQQHPRQPSLLTPLDPAHPPFRLPHRLPQRALQLPALNRPISAELQNNLVDYQNARICPRGNRRGGGVRAAVQEAGVTSCESERVGW